MEIILFLAAIPLALIGLLIAGALILRLAEEGLMFIDAVIKEEQQLNSTSVPLRWNVIFKAVGVYSLSLVLVCLFWLLK